MNIKVMIEELNRVTVHCEHRDDPIDACFVVRHAGSSFILIGELVDIADSAKDLLFKDKSESEYNALHKRVERDLTYFVGNQHYPGISVDPSDLSFDLTVVNENVVQEIDSVTVKRSGNDPHEKVFHLSTYESPSVNGPFDYYFLEDSNAKAGIMIAQSMNSDSY